MNVIGAILKVIVCYAMGMFLVWSAGWFFDEPVPKWAQMIGGMILVAQHSILGKLD